MPERTLVLIKPDGISRGLIGEIITRFERKGLNIAALKLMRISRGLAEKHYAVHRDKHFFPALVEFITSGPVVAMVVEGPHAIAQVRALMGATNPADADPGTIRSDYATITTFNLVHGSDAPETAEVEIANFFSADDILSYRRDCSGWTSEAIGE
jgi:nucleoside-diphosphate kinase